MSQYAQLDCAQAPNDGSLSTFGTCYLPSLSHLGLFRPVGAHCTASQVDKRWI